MYKKKKYLVAVFESGEKDLYKGTLDLLSYNKRRFAELEVQQEKKQRAAAAKRWDTGGKEEPLPPFFSLFLEMFTIAWYNVICK